MGLSFDGDPTTTRERKGYLEKVVRKRLRRLKAVVHVLQFVWTLYNTIRYFFALALAAFALALLQAHILGPAHTNPALT
ncbi:hypothetical protein K438DRAFT_1955777 [Mycena galopus ATCC 62051]|nr:hypothetical protein K438DRAFT_1955777 [Mycena galopus ATCC 62051]